MRKADIFWGFSTSSYRTLSYLLPLLDISKFNCYDRNWWECFYCCLYSGGALLAPNSMWKSHHPWLFHSFELLSAYCSAHFFARRWAWTSDKDRFHDRVFFRCIPLTSKKNIMKFMKHLQRWLSTISLISLEVIYNSSPRRTNSKPSSSPLVAQHHLTVQKSHHRAAL